MSTPIIRDIRLKGFTISARFEACVAQRRESNPRQGRVNRPDD